MVTGLDLIAAHLVGDYILQTDDMAARKLSDSSVRRDHVVAYSAPFLVLMLITGVSFGPLIAFLALNAVAHFVVDSRRWASGEKWAPKPILVDQTIHMVCLSVLWHLILS